MNQTESKDILLEALSELDNQLAEIGYSNLDIKIVGGFALIIQDIRDNGFTQDIDSMTKGFDPKVTTIIATIGKEMGIKLGWLNADMVLDDPEIIEQIVGKVNFTPYGNYRVLNVSVADLPSLLRLKIVAAGDNLEVLDDTIEFERHFEDVTNLIKALKISSLYELRTIAPIIEDYPELQMRLFSSAREV
jgi:hypothetical protein